MAHGNVNVVRDVVDAVNRRDPDGFIACLHPHVEWEDSEGFTGLRGVSRGRVEVREWFEEAFLDLWEHFHVEIEEVTESSEGRVLLRLLLTARGRDSHVETEARAWNVFWVVDGKIARRQLFRIEARDAALEAVGLRE